jgi:hypothetical protein
MAEKSRDKGFFRVFQKNLKKSKKTSKKWRKMFDIIISMWYIIQAVA